ncbi:hypothetical protein BYT27DRAFT_6950756 [Phlegmacium glaucopus]|nr:hypothetical protein BYT27DRAFT_6547840 [Phlegmacium glaucopus]KAF8814903.1 hypothetical protein BYT27DRAFT_6950756 [Phlegmacium glaucopus]
MAVIARFGDRLRQQQRPHQLATWTHRAHRVRHLPNILPHLSIDLVHRTLGLEVSIIINMLFYTPTVTLTALSSLSLLFEPVKYQIYVHFMMNASLKSFLIT